MECSTDTSINTNATYASSTPFSHHSPSSPSSSPPITPTPTQTQTQPQTPPPQNVVVSPCAACKILRRRCAEKCVLAPYFPPSEPAKFTIAHRVFGASNIIKFLQVYPIISLNLTQFSLICSYTKVVVLLKVTNWVQEFVFDLEFRCVMCEIRFKPFSLGYFVGF